MPTTKRPRRTTPVDHNPRALRQARIRAGILQQDLAGQLGIAPSTLSEAESGKRWINPKVRARLAEILNCDPITFKPIKVPAKDAAA